MGKKIYDLVWHNPDGSGIALKTQCDTTSYKLSSTNFRTRETGLEVKTGTIH